MEMIFANVSPTPLIGCPGDVLNDVFWAGFCLYVTVVTGGPHIEELMRLNRSTSW